MPYFDSIVKKLTNAGYIFKVKPTPDYLVEDDSIDIIARKIKGEIIILPFLRSLSIGSIENYLSIVDEIEVEGKLKFSFRDTTVSKLLRDLELE